MRSWTEDFGKFYTNASEWDAKKKICIGYNDDTTGEDMVIMAIKLAKRYNCKIVGRVEYTPEAVGGTVSFIVECHSLTYRYFYDGGKTLKVHNSEVKEKDLQKYEEQFGTRKCYQEEKDYRFYFMDNWNGTMHTFPTLRKAKAAARQQTGNSCCIYETQPYGRGSKIACFAPASGFTPP